MNKNNIRRLLIAVAFFVGTNSYCIALTHVYEVVEKNFTAANTYNNPYMDVDLWVDLKGPDGETLRIPAFWDDGQSFKIRMSAFTKIYSWSSAEGKACVLGISS